MQIQRVSDPDLESDVVVLGEIPRISLAEAPATAPSDERIQRLIGSLANIQSPDFGLSATMSGRAFLAVEGQKTAAAFLLTDHNIESSDALVELVKIGPAALPMLLKNLDNATPTKLTIDHRGGGFGAMWFANELWGNPLNKVEQSVLQASPKNEADSFDGEHVESYTVKVGDVCLVAIGQITGRGYQAVRYQPTACVVLNSPTNDPELCAHVRAMWHSDDPRQTLFDSLLLDYATRGKFNGDSLDGWDEGSFLQIEAVMRLLYYFPADTGTLIADRIDTLDVSSSDSPGVEPADESELDWFIRREVANGVRTEQFIAATLGSRHPDVVAAIKRVADRADDDEIINLMGKAREPADAMDSR